MENGKKIREICMLMIRQLSAIIRMIDQATPKEIRVRVLRRRNHLSLVDVERRKDPRN